jgi:plasmid stabilization system protein ParE
MRLEWSDAALSDLNRFVEFLNREHPSLAPVVASEIIAKASVLSEHPRLGRPWLAEKNIARSHCKFSARLTFFSIVWTKSVS